MKETETSKVHPDAVAFHVITSIMASSSSKPRSEPIPKSKKPASALDQHAKSSSEAVNISMQPFPCSLPQCCTRKVYKS